jgi:hypothetical protein
MTRTAFLRTYPTPGSKLKFATPISAAVHTPQALYLQPGCQTIPTTNWLLHQTVVSCSHCLLGLQCSPTLIEGLKECSVVSPLREAHSLTAFRNDFGLMGRVLENTYRFSNVLVQRHGLGVQAAFSLKLSLHPRRENLDNLNRGIPQLKAACIRRRSSSLARSFRTEQPSRRDPAYGVPTHRREDCGPHCRSQ